MTLIVNTREFKVHKVILGTRSPYFHRLFFGNFKEKDQSTITLHDVDADSFANVLDFIYDRDYRPEPALLQLLKLYGIKVDDHRLHKRMVIPAEQFFDYVQTMLDIYGTLDQKHIDIMASKVPPSTSLASLPDDLRNDITGSHKYHYYNNDNDADITKLLQTKKGEKRLYDYVDHAAVGIGKGNYTVQARSPEHAYLKVRGYHNKARYQTWQIAVMLYRQRFTAATQPTNLPPLRNDEMYICGKDVFHLYDDKFPNFLMDQEISLTNYRPCDIYSRYNVRNAKIKTSHDPHSYFVGTKYRYKFKLSDEPGLGVTVGDYNNNSEFLVTRDEDGKFGVISRHNGEPLEDHQIREIRRNTIYYYMARK